MKILKFLVAAVSVTGLIACSSHEILPDKVTVKVSRDDPSKDCKLVGPVTGSVIHVGDDEEAALANLKKDTARHGGNYVQYESSSADGLGLRGTAYYCP